MLALVPNLVSCSIYNAYLLTNPKEPTDCPIYGLFKGITWIKMKVYRVTKWTGFVGIGIFDILSIPGQSGPDTLSSAFPPNYLYNGNNSADNHQTLKGLREKSLVENLTREDQHHVWGAWVFVSFYISYTRCQRCQKPDLWQWWLTLTSQGVQFPKQCQWSSTGLMGCGSVHIHQTGVNLQNFALRTTAAQATAVAAGPLSRGTVVGYVPHQGQQQANLLQWYHCGWRWHVQGPNGRPTGAKRMILKRKILQELWGISNYDWT